MGNAFLVAGFSFFTLNISYHSLLACRVTVEKSAYNLMGVPLYVICHFSCVAFNSLSLSLIFVSLITIYGTMWPSKPKLFILLSCMKQKFAYPCFSC